MIRKTGFQETVAPVEKERAQRPNEQMFREEGECFKQGKVLQVGDYQGCKSTEEPTCPSSVQPSHLERSVVAHQQNQKHEKGDVAWVEDEHTFFPDDFPIASIDKV